MVIIMPKGFDGQAAHLCHKDDTNAVAELDQSSPSFYREPLWLWDHEMTQ